MKELNFKYYPSRTLILMILLTASILIFLKQLITQHTINGSIFISEIATVGAIAFVFTMINRFVKWNWYLKLLGITNVSGRYSGELISSFHEDDDPAKPNIKMRIELDIAQNINGIKVFGTVSPEWGIEGKTSDFESEWTHLQALENGKYLLEYRYSNRSNVSHSWHKKYKLTSHTGFASLIYNPETNILEGFYFTYENQSRGNISLTLNK